MANAVTYASNPQPTSTSHMMNARFLADHSNEHTSVSAFSQTRHITWRCIETDLRFRSHVTIHIIWVINIAGCHRNAFSIVAPHVNVTESHRYAIRDIVSVAESHRYAIRDVVSIAESHRYTIRDVVNIAETHRYAVATFNRHFSTTRGMSRACVLLYVEYNVFEVALEFIRWLSVARSALYQKMVRWWQTKRTRNCLLDRWLIFDRTLAME